MCLFLQQNVESRQEVLKKQALVSTLSLTVMCVDTGVVKHRRHSQVCFKHLIPVRVLIHSSVVSTSFSKSWFESTASGTLLPQPTILQPELQLRPSSAQIALCFLRGAEVKGTCLNFEVSFEFKSVAPLVPK